MGMFIGIDLKGSQLHWGIVLTVTIATIAYCLLGGLIFQAIEGPHEQTQYNLAMEHFNQTLHSMKVNTREDLILLTMSLKANIIPYVAFVNGTLKTKDEWNFFRSVLFACTIFTTIGYGNVVPHTSLGRWIVILYAVIGIPLFVFTMACLASKMYGLMELFPQKVGRCRCLQKKKQKAVVLATYFMIGLIIFIILPMIVFAHTEKWSYGESLYFSFVTLSTIGFGDYVPQASYGQSGIYLMSVVLYIAFGLAWLSGLVAAASDWWSIYYTRAYDRMRSEMRTRLQDFHRNASETFNNISTRRKSQIEEEEEVEVDEKSC